MAKEDWIKIHTDIIDDVKIRRLSKIPESFKMWVGLLCLCRRDGIDNCVCINENIPYEPQELAEILTVSHRDFLEFLKESEKLRMIEINDGFIFILNWDKRQLVDGGRWKKFNNKHKTNTEQTQSKQPTNILQTDNKHFTNEPQTEGKQPANDLQTTEQNRTEQSREEQNRKEQTAEQNRETNGEQTEKQIPVAAAVASFASVLGKGNCSAAAAAPPVGNRPIASELVRIGVSLQKTEELLSRHSEEVIRKQIDWLPFRNLNKPVAGLVKAIEQNWEMPALPQTEKQKAEMEHLTKVRKCAEKYPDCAKLNVEMCSQCPNVVKKRSEKPDT